MLRRQVRRPRREARSAVNVDGLRQILMERSLDHNLLAYVAKGVSDRAGRYVASENVTHVLPGRSVSRHVSKVPAFYGKIQKIN